MHSNRLVTALATVALAAAPFAAGAQSNRGNRMSSNGDVMMMNQKQVVDHLITGDSLEVQMAQLAAARTKNAAVKNFANVLVTDHSRHLIALHKLAGKRDIGRAANPADSSGIRTERMLSRMKSISTDSSFDRMFVSQQIRHHARALAELKALRSAAKDDDLQQDIDATRPVLERHLALARGLAGQMGIPADTGRMGQRGMNGMNGMRMNRARRDSTTGSRTNPPKP
jgi:putative membrane protein